jgi:hypothetical protein
MNETPALPPPDRAEPTAEPPPVRRSTPRNRNLVPWVYALGFVVLSLSLLWMWQNPNPTPQAAAQSKQIDALAQQIQVLSGRVEQLAQRPEPAAVDLAPLEQRVAALEKRPAPAADLAPIQQQIAALRSQIAATHAAGTPASDFARLENAVAALEQQALPMLKSQLDAIAQQVGKEQNETGSRLAQLEASQRALTTRIQEIDTAFKAEQASVATQVQSMQQEVGAAVAAADKAARLARLNIARAALEAGQPVGTIDGAPPALARFADTKPPTEAALRLAFPAAAKAALDAARPSTAGKPFGERMWQQVQGLITIREGDEVIVGNPAAGVLARARQELDAGDIAAAVASVSTLSGPAAEAMSGWLAQAKALLAARAALDTMAPHA